MNSQRTYANSNRDERVRAKEFMNERNQKRMLFKNRESNKSMNNHVYSIRKEK